MLQLYIDTVVEWLKENGLLINVTTCPVISFYKSKVRNPLFFEYKLTDPPLQRVSEVRDMGIYFDSNLTFKYHIDYVVSRVSRLIGCIKRTTTDFKDPQAIIHLYQSLVLPIIVFGSKIWSQYTQVDFKRLECVQYKILRFISWKMRRSMSMTEHYYTDH